MNEIRCRHASHDATVFQFPAGGTQLVKCWKCALCHPPMLGRSVKIALVVGTVLAVINHGDHLMSGAWSARVVLKIALTYLVPFAVATCSALMNSRVRNI